MESKKINQLATELSPALSDLTIIGDPATGVSKKITLSQMASLFTGTVEEYPNLASFPLVGVADTIYIALDTNVLYRWDTSLTSYVELSPNIINSLVFNDANGFDGTISLVGSVATLTITTALTTGSVGFIGASGALLQDNANFFWDDTNNRLGIGTNAPTTAIDTFGSGIITRVNGTSTNNAFIGFASAGTNKWSVGNVQSDHRFRIYNEATTSELVSVLQTGEFGIGIANPTTKIHIDGGASALIANLDANVSVAKSVSFRSDNSNRINLEVSGTESGSNAGANFFIRRYSDAGSLIDTPLTITRSTGAISLTTALSGTTANFSGTITGRESNGTAFIIGNGVDTDLYLNVQTGNIAFNNSGIASAFSFVIGGNTIGIFNPAGFSVIGSATANSFIPNSATVPTNGMYLSAANTLNFATNTTNRLSISSTGVATFTGTLSVTGASGGNSISVTQGISIGDGYGLNAGNFQVGAISANRFYIYNGTLGIDNMSIVPSTGITTFNRGVSILNGNVTTSGTYIGRTTNGQAFGCGNGIDSDLGIFVQTGNIAFSNTGTASGFSFALGGVTRFSIGSTGAATFSNSINYDGGGSFRSAVNSIYNAVRTVTISGGAVNGVMQIMVGVYGNGQGSTGRAMWVAGGFIGGGMGVTEVLRSNSGSIVISGMTSNVGSLTFTVSYIFPNGADISVNVITSSANTTAPTITFT
jgi:hypothetical protein